MKEADYSGNLLRRIYNKGIRSKWLKVFIILLCALGITYLIGREIILQSLVFGDAPLVTLKSGPVIMEYALHGWNRAIYGENLPSPLAYLFLSFFNELAAYAGNIQVFNLLLNLSFPLSFLTFYIFSAKFCKSFWLRIFGAAFYILNPVVLTLYGAGGFMWVLVFLPLSLYFLINFLEKQTYKNLAKTAVFTSLTMWTFPSLTVILVLTLSVIVLSYLFMARSKLDFLKTTFPRFLVLLLLVVALNSAFLYSQYTYNQSASNGYNPQSILNDFKYTYTSMTIDNLLRFTGNIASPQSTLGYVNPLNITNEVSMIIPIIVLMSVFWVIKNRENKNPIIAMLISIAFISALTFIIRTVVYSDQNSLITSSYFSMFWTLRNPLKLQIMLVVCAIPLFIFALEKIAYSAINFFRQRKRFYAVLALSLVFLGVSQIYIYNTYAFDGHAGLNLTYGASSYVYDEDSTLARIVNDSMQWYKNGTYRGIILPFDHTTELYVEFTNPLLYPTRLGLDSNIPNMLTDAMQNGANFDFVLSLLGTKYVYVNNAWTDTSFHIIQANAQILKATLKDSNFNEENFTGYSKFIVDTALPHVYLSSYNVYFSNIQTIPQLKNSGLLNSATFQSNPIFFEMKKVEQQPITSGTPSNLAYDSYNWTLPQQANYYIYPVIISNQTEVPAYAILDGQVIANATSAVSLPYETSMAAGNHTFSFATGNAVPFQSLKTNSTYHDNEPVSSNVSLTSDEYDRFDLHVQFKSTEWGPKDWNGPEIYFNYLNDSSNVRLIFHQSGYLELAKSTKEGYQPGVITRQCNLNSGDSWNDLRVIKYNDTLVVDLNGQNLLSFTDPVINQTGKLGLGSDVGSSTIFQNATVNKNVLAGIWALPTEKKSSTPFTLIDGSDPTKYVLQLNQTDENSPMLYLGENFDPGWAVTIDGEPLGDQYHLEANLYANSWSLNTGKGPHEIEIYYRPNTTYQILLYASITGLFTLAAVGYLPTIVRMKALMHRKKQTT